MATKTTTKTPDSSTAKKPLAGLKHKHTVVTPEGQLIEVTARPIGKQQASARRTKQAMDALFETDDLVKEQAAGFVTFLREHAIVGLAVGFVVGTQAQSVVKQLVASFIDPFIQLIIGGAKLSDRKFTLSLFQNHADFSWGAMVYALINLLCVLATIYVLIKILKLDKLDKPKDKSSDKADKASKTPTKK